MEKLSFETLLFCEKQDFVEVIFLKIFSFVIPKETLNKIGKFLIDKNSISFDAQNSKQAFSSILDEGMLNLTNKVTGKKTIYVHKNSGIPLIGNIGFGLIDRGTNIIEVRPISGCNIKCVYCSVDEDKRSIDFVVDADYLVEEFKKLVVFKGVTQIEAHIASQGEPTMYADLARLVAGIKKISQVSTISIDTNGTFLTTSKIDELLSAGLNRINFSINAIADAVAKKIADVGEGYNIKKILETAKYLSDKVNLIIAPVYVPGWNDSELDKIVEFTKSLNNKKFEPKCYIQNFLQYRFGRNPVKQQGFELFFKTLKALEKKHNMKLIIEASDFNILKTKSLPKPFKEGDVIKAKIACQGRLPNEFLAVANNRTISLTNPKKQGIVNVKITGDKHNLFYGVVI